MLDSSCVRRGTRQPGSPRSSASTAVSTASDGLAKVGIGAYFQRSKVCGEPTASHAIFIALVVEPSAEQTMRMPMLLLCMSVMSCAFGQDDANVLLVKSVLKGSPSQMTGQVRVGDAVVSVDGCDCYGFSLAELAEKLLGHPGTEVICCFRNQ